MISRFINALKARIDAYQKRKHREGKRVHPTTLHYVWAREFGECKGKKHYHLMLLVNRDTRCRAGDYRAPESLAGMIKQAWCSALGVDVGCHATLVHFPARPAVWLARNDDTGFQLEVLERADYLAKVSIAGGVRVMTSGFRKCWNGVLAKLTAPVSAILAVAGVEHDWRANIRQTKSMGCCLAATMYPLAH